MQSSRYPAVCTRRRLDHQTTGSDRVKRAIRQATAYVVYTNAEGKKQRCKSQKGLGSLRVHTTYMYYMRRRSVVRPYADLEKEKKKKEKKK